MEDSSNYPATPSASQKIESMKSAVQWYDSPSLSFQRRAKSDIPKNSQMEEDPFFGKKVDSESETSNSCDGFNARLPHSSRKFRRRLRPSTSIEELNEKEERKTDEMMNEKIESEVSRSPASSNSFQTNGEDLIQQGRRSIQLLKLRRQTIGKAEDEDITTPKRKRKLEDEESIEKENGYEEEDFEENEEKKIGVTLLTPSLSRRSHSKRGRICEKWPLTPLSSSLPSVISCESISSNSLTPRRISGGRSSKRDELIDTPEGNEKDEEIMRMKEIGKEKKAIKRAKYGHLPEYNSDDSFYDSD
ncbi:hypothetical protein PRIPAC_72423 [Pristionchus pacificus]|nr:hypothetical protein PRIPAC_72423 [Pristionchus pacificus]